MSSPPPRASPGPEGTRAPVASDPVFDQAMDQFEKRLTKTQMNIFAQCTIDDVKNQIQEIQDKHGSRRRLRHMGRLSKFVEGMMQLGQVVEVFLNIHNGVAFIWGPFKFLLLMAKTWIDSLDCLLEVYGRIGEVLPNLARYAEIYEKYPSVHTHLKEYYCDILEFHSNALEVFSRSGWKALFRSAWKTFNTQFEPILKSLERHRVMLSEEKLTAVMEETQTWGKSIEDKFDRLEKSLQERDRKDVENCLAAHRDHLNQQRRIVESKIDAPGYHDDHELALQKRHQSTPGNWIPNHPLLSKFLETSTRVNRKIYLSGIPGAGKTVLTSRLISHLKQQQLKKKGSAEKFSVAYFYFKHLQPEKRTLVSLLLALLSQLIDQDEALLDHVYQACYETGQQRLRSLDAVSDLVSMAIQSQSLCFVIVDGLDECQDAYEVLKWFAILMSSRENDPPGGSEPCIRLFISGQRDGVIEPQMSQYHSIQLETITWHNKDIEAFTMDVAGKIREKFSLDSKAEQEIVARVTSQARGMFLYAQLVVSNLLAQTSKYNLKQELKEETFPEGLNQAYERVIIQVLRNPRKAERDDAKKIIGMIICACRPLHWREIQSKFCIDVSTGNADLDRQLLMTCKQLCGSLVETSYLEPPFSSPCEEVVDLVHSTAKTYLVATKEISMEAENAKMALFCAEYLLSRPLTPGISKPEVEKYATSGYYGFQDYAVAFWWQHAQQVLACTGLETELGQRALQAVHRATVDIGELAQGEGSSDPSGDIQSLKSEFKRVSQDLREWESIKNCEMRTTAIREVIDSLLNIGPSVLPFYGPWRYKCPKPWCQFFNSGFEEPQHRQIHINQHELPFLCDFKGCDAAKIGFASEAALKTHAKRWHPNDEQPLFPTAKRHSSGRPDIKKAAKLGDLDTIKDLVGKGFSPDHRNRFKKPVLHTAAENGHLHVLRYLTQMGADVNVKGENMTTALHISVARRDLEVTTFLCDLDGISLSEDFHSQTALDYAVSTDPFNKAIINQLLSKATPEMVQNALLLAIRSKKVMAVRHLAEHIDVHCFVQSSIALEVAAETGNFPCLEALLSSGKTDPNVRSPAGRLPIHAACISGNLPAIQRLYPLTTNTDLKDGEGNSLQHLAVKHDHEDILSWILQKGADVNAADKDGQTPLLWALQYGQETVARLLINAGADVNAVDENGWTILFGALQHSQETVIKLLIDAGADVNAVNEDGRTPLFWALQHSQETVIKLLIDAKADVNTVNENGLTPLFWALQHSQETVVKLLIDAKADVNTVNENGQTPLFWALQYGQETVARLLINAGADVNVTNEGHTPLFLALRANNWALVRLLINAGADVNFRSENGSTLLFWTSRNNKEVLTDLLIDAGADVNATNEEGHTPLFLASRNDHVALAKLLIDKGANVNASSKDGSTPLYWASSKGYMMMEKLLISKGADTA